MESLNIAILESDAAVLQKFSHLNREKKKLFVANNYEELHEILSQNNIQLVLFSLDQYEQLPPLRQLVRKKEHLFAIFSKKENPSEKSNLISRGVWFFWNINNGVSQLTDQIMLITTRQKLIRHLRKGSETIGNLAEIPLREIITNLAFNQRSVRLAIFSNFGKSVMFFKQGTLTHARQGRLRGNAAVLNTFIWPAGSFLVQETIVPDTVSNVNASFIALIAEGIYRKEQFWNYWSKKLNFNSPIIVRDTNPKSLTPKVNKLLQWVTRQNSLLQILMFSESDAWQLVHDFDKLLEKNIIEYIPDSENVISREGYTPEDKSFFSKSEARTLEKVLFAGYPDAKEGKFIVAGNSGSGLIEFIRALSGKMSAPVKQVQNLIFSRILLVDKYISFFGVTIEDKFTEFIQKLSDNMFGFILLIDARNKKDLEFTSYVINSLLSSYPNAIFAVGLTHSEKARALPIDLIKQTIQLPEFIRLNICNIEDPASILELIFSLREIPKTNIGK